MNNQIGIGIIMKNKKIKYLLLIVLVPFVLVLLYFSKLNENSLEDIEADNIEKLQERSFDIINFDLNRKKVNRNTLTDHNFHLFRTFSDYPINKSYKELFYANEFYGQYSEGGTFDENNKEVKVAFTQSFAYEKMFVRLVAMYKNKEDLFPFIVNLRPYQFYDWYEKAYPIEYSKKGSEYAIVRYEKFFQDYSNQTFESFKNTGYILRETKLKNGSDILINNTISPYFYFVIKKLNNGKSGLQFKSYYKKKIQIPLFERLF